MLVKLDGANSSSVLDGFTRRLRSVPESLRRTLTYDQGTEMALHQTLAKRLRMDIFFCDPHRPRKILGFKTPNEVFSDLKLNNITGVALQA